MHQIKSDAIQEHLYKHQIAFSRNEKAFEKLIKNEAKPIFAIFLHLQTLKYYGKKEKIFKKRTVHGWSVACVHRVHYEVPVNKCCRTVCIELHIILHVICLRTWLRFDGSDISKCRGPLKIYRRYIIWEKDPHLL